MASYTDVDALIDWIGNEATENAGGAKKLIKPAMTPTMLFPFAAPRVGGELSDAGARAEMEMRVLLWSVERLIGGLSKIGYDSDVDTHLHVVLPGSPNRGTFGGDGAYGEAKASLIAVVNRWKAERNWAERVTLAHAVIGWVRGTGLMGHNDPIVDAVEAAGVRTWSTQEMATQLLKTATRESRRAAAEAPLEVDLTGGLAEANLDLAALAKEAAEVAEIAEAVDEAVDESSILALPAPARIDDSVKAPSWPELDVTPRGPRGHRGCRRARTLRFLAYPLRDGGRRAALCRRRSRIGVEHRTHRLGERPPSRWYDVESGDLVPEAEIADKYHDAVSSVAASVATSTRRDDRQHRSAAHLRVPGQGSELRGRQ